MSTEVNEAIVRRHPEDALAETGRGKLAATDELLNEDAAFYDPGQPPSVGAEAQRPGSAMLCGASPDAPFAIEDVIAEGDKVAVRWTFCGTHRSEFAGMPPTGEKATMTGITVHRLVRSHRGRLGAVPR